MTRSGVAAVALLAVTPAAFGIQPTKAELGIARKWSSDRFGARKTDPPFSFLIVPRSSSGARASNVYLRECTRKVNVRRLDDDRTERTVVFTDKSETLRITALAIEYLKYPVVEWTVFFKNTGSENSPIISDIQALNDVFGQPSVMDFTLHRTVGDGVQGMYSPDPIAMKPGAKMTLAPFGGRPSSNEFPYFNVEWPGGGVVVAVGWPGQWAAHFDHEGKLGFRIRAGQERTRFSLLPGEELRTPLIATLFFKGDHARSQNLWRSWMLAHNIPRPKGQLPKPQLNVCNSNSYGYFGQNEANQREWIQRYRDEGINFDYWWIDLCWFNIVPETLVSDALYNPHPVWYPNGLKGISDDLHRHGQKLIVWFEPEHHYPGPANWICANHPEWLLKLPPGRENEFNQGMPLKDRQVLNLGNPDALKWLTDNTERVIREQGIDYYRHDFNVEPLDFWRANDSPDRQGVTENKYVTGFLAYFDELLKRHPGLQIDNCASGGRRNDIETLRRSLPLLRSDTWGEPVGQQCQTYGLASWIPYWGTGIMYSEEKDLTYIFRSQMGPSFTSCWDLRPKADYSLHRRILEQWKEVREVMVESDFYPLTPYSAANNVWCGWQYDQPAKGKGVVQVFRRAESPVSEITLKLRGLDVKARYEVRDQDSGQKSIVSGRQLAQKGLTVVLVDKPGSAVILYRKVPN